MAEISPAARFKSAAVLRDRAVGSMTQAQDLGSRDSHALHAGAVVQLPDRSRALAAGCGAPFALATAPPPMAVGFPLLMTQLDDVALRNAASIATIVIECLP